MMRHQHKRSFGKCIVQGTLLALLTVTTVNAGDWTRFRGPNGAGVSDDKVPVKFSETENLKWKAELPGRGVSSPIVVGDKVFVTCYSGYGMDRENPGSIEDLKRHLVCVNRYSGDIVWSKTIAAVQPEDPYTGPGVPSHGYASHTPVSDGERVYAFFGKSGVYAFDLEGNELWHQSVGTESGPMRWGSAASPILNGDQVIVNASDEGEALVSFDKLTGEQKWKAEAAGLGNTWGTPVLMDSETGEELVIAVPGEIWGFNPETGKLKWYSTGPDDQSANASVIPGDGVVYSIDGRGGRSVAVKVGGKKDVNATNIVWEGRAQARIATPVLYEGRIYWISNGIANCISAETGESVYRARLSGEGPVDEPQQADRGGDRGGPGRGGPGRGGPDGGGPGGPGGGFGGRPPGGPGGGGPGGPGGGGRGGGSRGGAGDYSSPIIAGGNVYAPVGNGTIYVFPAGDKFELLAENRFASDDSGIASTPAVSDGQMFIRSNKYLYCIAGE